MINRAIFPNALTAGNLLLGIISLINTMGENYNIAAYCVLVSGILDALDGKVARKLKVSSEFGKQLDSLSDLVSFGVAPALLVYSSNLIEYKLIGLIVAISFAMCGAFRLARFNIMNITTHFVGIPITLAGGLLAIIVLLSHMIPVMAIFIMTLILAYMMIANFRVPKF